MLMQARAYCFFSVFGFCLETRAVSSYHEDNSQIIAGTFGGKGIGSGSKLKGRRCSR